MEFGLVPAVLSFNPKSKIQIPKYDRVDMKKSIGLKKSVARRKNWAVYMVRCRDGTLYTGISNNVRRRVETHNKGRGAKYIVPARRPVELAYVEEGYTLPMAMKREIKIKKGGKTNKEKLAGIRRSLCRKAR